MRKTEILPFITTWIDLEDTMLSEISQTEKDKYCSTYIRNLKKLSLQKQNVEWWFPGAGGGGIGEMLTKG